MKVRDPETQGYIDGKVCCACVHFHWGMGEMGYCDLKKYKCCCDAGEWHDSCDINKFEWDYMQYIDHLEKMNEIYKKQYQSAVKELRQETIQITNIPNYGKNILTVIKP